MKKEKLHPSLQPFGRDHGVGLVCAQRLRKSIRASKNDRIKVAEQMRAVCCDVIGRSLQDEQGILEAVVKKSGLEYPFWEHHARLQSLIKELEKADPSKDPGLGLISQIADALDDYVRWEENTLFTTIADKLTAEELNKLKKLTDEVEAFHHRPTQELHASVTLNKDAGKADTCGCSIAQEKSTIS